jgi:hypothetical protein
LFALIAWFADTYIVEAICDERFGNNNRQYLVKWEGFPHTSNTWEPVSSFINTDILTAWKKSRANTIV